MKHTKVFRDANHAEIVKKLIDNHYRVIDLAAIGSSVPDILVAHGTTIVLIEIKMPKSQIYLDQIEFGCRWPGYYGLAETYEQALGLMSDPMNKCLSLEAKGIALGICAEWRAKTKVKDDGKTPKPKIRIMEFEKQLAERLAK